MRKLITVFTGLAIMLSTVAIATASDSVTTKMEKKKKVKKPKTDKK